MGWKRYAEYYGSHTVHNENAYKYLKALKNIAQVDFRLNETLQRDFDRTFHHELSDYNQGYAYADFYSQLISHIQDNFDAIAKANANHQDEFDEFILSIFENDNGILESTYQKIDFIVNGMRHDDNETLNEKIRLSQQNSPANMVNSLSLSPYENEQNLPRLKAVFSENFNITTGANIPSVRKYSYQNSFIRELRFSTRGIRKKGKSYVDPLFAKGYLPAQQRRFLKEQAVKNQPIDSNKITYIYFNRLHFDQKLLNDFEGYDRLKQLKKIEAFRESAFSDVLHDLEERNKNLAVITLPADNKDLLRRNAYKTVDDRLDYAIVKQKFLAIATGQNDPKGSDFFISPRIKQLLYGVLSSTQHYNTLNENEEIDKLLTKSFVAMGIKKGDTFSTAQQQAVWFHFINYELTNDIIEKLSPKGYNFSCKDAIDRGAVASAYYNLIKSFDSNIPITEAKFNEGLHAAAVAAKGRGMNHHLNLIWNAVDAYVDANFDTLIADPYKSWLINWRNKNCPHERINDCLPKIINQYQQCLNSLHKEDPEAKAKEILAELKDYHQNYHASGKRLMLDIANLTFSLVNSYHNKDHETEKTFKNELIEFNNLANKLHVSHENAFIVAGLMKMLVGALTFNPKLINEGLATFNKGGHAEARNEASRKMNDMHNSINDTSLTSSYKKELHQIEGSENSNNEADSEQSDSQFSFHPH